MSRIERERLLLAEKRWPAFQSFLSEYAADTLYGDIAALIHQIRAALLSIAVQEQAVIASQCWDFMAFFQQRYDDGSMLRDAFGARGRPPTDNRGAGHMALARVKLVYDQLAESVRKQLPDWKPEPLGL
jgi:hypothetical protein